MPCHSNPRGAAPQRSVRLLSLAAWLALGVGPEARPLPPAVLRELRGRAERWSREEAPRRTVLFAAVSLRYYEAEDLARRLREVLRLESEGPEGERVLGVFADARANALLFAGTPEGVARVRGLLEHVREPAEEPERGAAVVYLERARAAELYGWVRRFLAPELEVVADAPDNALLLAGPSARVAELRAILAALDREPSATERELRTGSEARA